ncbi:MAG: hypothetical protein JOZ24_02480, partial [Candidatus Eremiobacteraeota bacterium]|nr:hypothetical protein [Candidatus Eremiobacteraeota bacterium]
LSEGDAEARKLRIGLAGAGEHLRDELIAALARTLEDTRANGSALHQIVMTGNGARLPTLAEALGRSVAVPVRDARLGIAASTALPPDVVRAASLDWSLAVGLALWDNAG